MSYGSSRNSGESAQGLSSGGHPNRKRLLSQAFKQSLDLLVFGFYQTGVIGLDGKWCLASPASSLEGRDAGV